MADLVSGISKLNPFSKKVDEDDKGEKIDAGTVAGGGHASQESHVTKDKLRVSEALKSYLVKEKVLQESEAGLKSDEPTTALRELLDKNHINVPREVIDRNHPLPEYFISSSHNTYLMAHQLFGESHAQAYEIALHTGSRCVEIDAWDNDDNKDEPKVTHGYTLVSNIPFREVCETIRDVVDKEAANEKNAAPIMISLENHCDAHGQLRLAQILQEVLGHRLLSKDVRDKGAREQVDPSKHEHVTLAELGNKVAVIVEYHLPNEEESSSSSDSSSDEEEQKQAHQEYVNRKKATSSGHIIPELAELGVYAQSVKPVNNSWFESELENAPHHQLINVSESGLRTHLSANSAKIARHNAHHLMRVYPKGTRISSKNLAPVPFWGIGAQICALNWQTFGASSQINEALFAGSGGYVLKPAALRAGGSGKLSTGNRKKLRLHVAGATDVPLPGDREHEDIKPYLTCTLVHPNDLNNMPPKRKTAGYKPHKLTGFLHKDNSPANDPVWKEVLEWEFEDNELVFLRMLIKSDDSFARNPIFAVAAVRLMYVTPGWNFIRMLDLGGHETTCTLLVRFELLDI
ncbi:PLC-like phosphodiesterase [Stemphylium lycopersici]|uniref:Phosphoinositide phospholipase C n=1 Tax=Stemphylium lycopersici TaxID=183478 RepID=A0A364N6T2_STELY|nr:phosphatidylinositol-specific phospholipase c [Stemphylium lycopersici]RAR03602.1 PLC-like phosphodiesterase [Stemphylium lycopersici]RAR12947.1 PLC-like phosphodiesterase [Stemphylium lycopersici]